MKKISILLMLIFILILGTQSQANSNLSLSDFLVLMSKNGASLSAGEVPDDVKNILLNEYPVIIKSNDETKIFIYPTKTIQSNFGSEFKNWSFTLTGSGINQEYLFNILPKYSGNMGYIAGSARYSKYAYYYDLTNQTFNSALWVNSAKGYAYNFATAGAKFGYKNSDGLSDFTSLSRLKIFLSSHLLFSGLDNIYYGESDVFYKFNGVIKTYPKTVDGTITYINSVGTINDDDVNLKFNYQSNMTYSDNQKGSLFVRLIKYSPSEVLKLDRTSPGSVGTTIIELKSDEAKPLEYSISYSELLSKMETNYIYRLLGYTEIFESSTTNSVGYDICTSCFFSLNDWRATDYEIKNIYKLCFVDNPSLEPIPGGSTGGNDLTIKDLNDNISSSIDNVNKNIQDTILGTPDESGERKGGLVGNLLEGLWKGLVALIIPDSETLGKWITDQTDKLSANAGFLTYSKTFWLSMCNLITNSSGDSDCIFVLPEFKVPGFNTVIWQEQNINLTSYFKNNENEVIKGFYTTYIVLVSGISIFYFCQYLWSLWDSIISGTHQITPEQNEDMQISHDFDMDNGMKTTSYTGRDINGQRYRLRYHYNSRKR